MATTADIRNGLCIEYNHGLYNIIEFQHVKPGKGPAFVRTKLKNIRTGKVLDNTFPSGHKIITARVERRPYQFLYQDDLGYHLMHRDTFEEIVIDKDLITGVEFLTDGLHMEVIVHDEKDEVLGCELPQFVELEVTYTEPGLKGDTATNASKPATLQTGAQVQVPLFINQGDWIRVDTREGIYMERVKK
ncbi:MAG: elongation factor P [Bernardetiaceae bacterium]